MFINSVDGAYYPSFFFMHIDSVEDVKIIEKNEQTFIHEYIHFLQDLILPYCIRNNLGILSEFRFVQDIMLKDKFISRPFSEWGEDQNLVRQQFEYTWGGNDFDNNQGKIIDVKSESFTIPSGQKVYKYILIFDSKSYHVGARDLLEYIAYKIEGRFWDTNEPDLPYTTVDKLFQYYQLDFIKPEVRLCISEYCLYNDNPIHMLISNFLKSNFVMENRKKFEKYDDCVLFLLSLQWSSKGGFQETIFSKTQRRLHDIKKWLLSQYSHPQFKSVAAWIEFVISYCKDNFWGKFIFSELYSSRMDIFWAKISKILHDIGMPIIENNRGKFINYLSSEYEIEEFVQFFVLFEFMNYIQTDSKECPIMNFCKANANCGIDYNLCSENPYDGINELELCPFKRFIKLYGFENRIK